jgi:hypothetical protein
VKDNPLDESDYNKFMEELRSRPPNPNSDAGIRILCQDRNRRFSPILDGKINPDFEGRMSDTDRIDLLTRVIHLLLDNIDYQAGNCRVNDMIGAVLPPEILRIAKEAVNVPR